MKAADNNERTTNNAATRGGTARAAAVATGRPAGDAIASATTVATASGATACRWRSQQPHHRAEGRVRRRRCSTTPPPPSATTDSCCSARRSHRRSRRIDWNRTTSSCPRRPKTHCTTSRCPTSVLAASPTSLACRNSRTLNPVCRRPCASRGWTPRCGRRACTSRRDRTRTGIASGDKGQAARERNERPPGGKQPPPCPLGAAVDCPLLPCARRLLSSDTVAASCGQTSDKRTPAGEDIEAGRRGGNKRDVLFLFDLYFA